LACLLEFRELEEGRHERHRLVEELFSLNFPLTFMSREESATTRSKDSTELFKDVGQLRAAHVDDGVERHQSAESLRRDGK
jgi:hypothetical protein